MKKIVCKNRVKTKESKIKIPKRILLKREDFDIVKQNKKHSEK
ncbi:hypothetical protein LEP1GSC125_3184 [Leptospira mayottensis 200901122]|uniref:Uncharacterized protein n=1 Tax=Leptospira mayottensis 200901122 TaxID=1193010 RepID=A0AA87SW40_9LEPT|nr:hypothetical protein LEP1GSC125_3184 [Leptospira mayottensis 200901122]